MSLNTTNTRVLVLTTTTTLKAASSSHNFIVISNDGISDVYLGIGEIGVINKGIRLGSPLSAHSAVTSRIIFDNNSKVHDVINAIALVTTTSVAIFYR